MSPPKYIHDLMRMYLPHFSELSRLPIPMAWKGCDFDTFNARRAEMPEKRLQKRRTCGIMGANPQKKGCALHEMSALPQP